MFDPTKPQAGTEIDAVEMRGQLNGLHDLITAIVEITAAQVDGVTTVNPTDPAAASVSVTGITLHFTFAIPRGNDGTQGIPGVTGAQGPPFAQAIVDAVNTLLPGTDATVSVSFDGTNVHFTYGIPRGNDGNQGPPGEVTAAQLAAAIVGTSSNTNAVATMDTPFTNDPPTLADLELVRTKMNEFILAARR
jgi:hypothetical protein